MDIIEYINNTKTTFCRFAATPNSPQTFEYIQFLLDNAAEAKREIRDMLKSSIKNEVDQANEFLTFIVKCQKFVMMDRSLKLSDLYMKWESLLAGIEAPIEITTNEIDRLWKELEGKYISGDKDDFIALCKHSEPKDTLENLTKNPQIKKGFDNAVIIDILLYLKYERTEIKQLLIKYFGYSRKTAQNAPDKHKPLSEVDNTKPIYANRVAVEAIFKK